MKVLQGKHSKEIFVYGPIGADFGGVDAKEFAQEVQATEGPVTVRINSPGGIVSEGWAMYQAMKRHPYKVTTSIDAEAASIASIIAMAGDTVEIAEHALFMIHHPWTFAMGNAHELRRMADTLDTHGERSITAYMSKTGADRGAVVQWMDEETWFTASESVEHGFADIMIETMPVAAWKVPQDWFKNTPKELISDEEGAPNPAAAAFHRRVQRARHKLIGIGT